MKLKSVSLENFRSKASSTVELGSRLTLLIGENGMGKTTILDAIAIALGEILTFLPEVKGIGFKDRGDIQKRNGKLSPYTRIKVVSNIKLVSDIDVAVDQDAEKLFVSWDRIQKRDKSQRTAKQIPKGGLGLKQLHRYLQESILDPWNADLPFELPVIVQYGVSRALLDLPIRRQGFLKEHSRFESLTEALNSTSRFRSAFIWFYNKENEERRLKQEKRDFNATLPELDAVRRCIMTLFPNLANPHIAINPLRFVIKQDGEELEIDQLSDGYKTMLGLAVDLSRRMAAANPYLNNPLAAEAIVMIDEVDLHLHPAWQQRVVSDLLKCFTNTQFILTTHSPILVESVNNLLKRHSIDSLLANVKPNNDWNTIRDLYPLDPSETRSYQISRDGVESLMDMDECLMADSLIDYFNEISLLFDQMRDLEYQPSRQESDDSLNL